MLPTDTNPHGTAFGGRIMEWMDIAAGIVAHRHCGLPVVTVAVDELHFKRPIHLGDVVMVHAMVNHAGTTSLEVGVRVEREDAHTHAREHCLSAYFIFVAVNADARPETVPPLWVVSTDEKRRFAAAVKRRAHRQRLLKAEAKASRSSGPRRRARQ